MEVLDITQKFTADNYPYGGKRTQAFFSVDFNAKKGFRTTFQTINPSNQRLNAPKHSTYSNFIALIKEENGHYDWKQFSIRGDEEIIKVFDFISEHFDKLKLTKDMHCYIAASAMQSRCISLSFTSFNTPESKEEFKGKYHFPFLQKVKLLLDGGSSQLYKESADILRNLVEDEKNYEKIC